jgi:hypothetical protein
MLHTTPMYNFEWRSMGRLTLDAQALILWALLLLPLPSSLQVPDTV